MPVTDAAYLPPQGRIRTIMTAFGTELTPVVEIVRYSLRLPDEETEDVAAYIEFESPLTIVNESIQSSQRSWMPLRILVYLYINESDSRILGDLIEHITKTLMTPDAVENYRNAFGADVGFSVEQITAGEIGFGEHFCQCKLQIDVLCHHED